MPAGLMNRGYNENMEQVDCVVVYCAGPGASKSFSQDDSIYSVLMPTYFYWLLFMASPIHLFLLFWKKFE